jgi:Fur family zinc uptake transcriptional regulator
MVKKNQLNSFDSKYVSSSLDLMKADGARLTKTRKAVLDCLSKTKKPLSPSEIMAEINGKKNTEVNIDLVSVYRILKYMSELSLVHQVGVEGGYIPCAHTQCGSQTHILTHCTSCQDTQEIHLPINSSTSILNYIKDSINFEANPHAIEIKGLCYLCKG